MVYLNGLDFTAEPHLFGDLANPALSDIEAFASELFRISRQPLVLVLTCNRAEVYSSGRISSECIERVLGLNPIAVKRYRYSSDKPVEHLFMLSSGVLSPRFGEDSIISQIRKGDEASRNAMVSSSELSKLFNMAVSFGKKIHSSAFPMHLDPAVISAILHKTEGAERVLIIGSGSYAREAAAALQAAGHQVSMTLRDISKIFLLPVGVKGLPYDERRSFVSGFDAVISATSGIYHTFEEEDMSLFRTDLIFDLSSPPDLPLSFRAYTASSLAGRNPAEESRYDEVLGYAEMHADEYRSWLECRKGKPGPAEAEDFAYAVSRRLRSTVERLDLPDEDRKSLLDAVFETVRKAYISELKTRRK